MQQPPPLPPRNVGTSTTRGKSVVTATDRKRRKDFGTLVKSTPGQGEAQGAEEQDGVEGVGVPVAGWAKGAGRGQRIQWKGEGGEAGTRWWVRFETVGLFFLLPPLTLSAPLPVFASHRKPWCSTLANGSFTTQTMAIRNSSGGFEQRASVWAVSPRQSIPLLIYHRPTDSTNIFF